MSRRRRAAGFTLIEMMVTLTVVVILLGIAAPSFQKIITNQRVKSASFDMFSALTYARSEAIKRNAVITLRAGATTNGAWTTGWRVVDAGGTALRSWAAVSNLAITESSGSNLTSVGFGRVGRLSPAPPPAPSLMIDSSAAGFGGLTARCLTVDASGRAATHTKPHNGTCP
jgi:type IV fimbrial biogenesis protein FimT